LLNQWSVEVTTATSHQCLDLSQPTLCQKLSPVTNIEKRPATNPKKASCIFCGFNRGALQATCSWSSTISEKRLYLEREA
jgi:hypothetical protein